MTDRELLELAAKAAGLWNNTDPSNGMLKVTGQYWNPLTDDGDALRLAVKLGMNIVFGANYVIVDNNVQAPTINNADDPYAATCRAIVRAAAEIGKGIIPPPIESDLPEDNYYKTIAEAEKTT